MRFPGIRLVEQTEQKFRRSESVLKTTSRDRPKSAPYLRLKNSKRTSRYQNIGELGTLL